MNRLDIATSKPTATQPSPASSTKARSHNSVFRWLTSFWNGLFGSKSPPHHQSLVDKSPILLQAFILEPMYTPSGLVDGIDETPDLATMDIDTPELPELGEDWDISDGESQTSSNADGDVDVTPEDADSSAEMTPETPLLTDQLEDIPFINPTFESGTFTVCETGEVSIDFLFDGGGYEGELAIFSLDGMDEFEPGSEEFIQEAASRALSDSELGHVVISDQTEGAKFVGELGESDRNSGEYLGVQTVQMRPGDEFGFMLVPNNTVQRVFDHPDVGGAARPLFSMATANPEDAFHTGQIADVTGDGSTFVMEDLRVDTKSDGDYNDVIFQVRGATGEAALMDEVIESGKDWRETDLGQALIDYTEPYITPDTPDDGELLTDELVGESPTDDIPVDESEIVTEPTTDESTDVVIDEPVNNSEIVTEPTTDESTNVATDEPVNTSEIIAEPTTDPELAEPVQNEFPQENQPLVGIIDTGFSDNNPDIDYSRISLGQDRIDGDDNPLMEAGEGNEHGTHVLGIIGATQDNDIGIEGINDDAPIWVGRAVGSGKWAESLVEFVDAAQESGQPNAVVNLSMDLTQIDADGNVTTRYEFTPQERSAIEYARQNNVMLVVAAGNDGGVMSALGQASQEFDNIITVGAAEQFDPETSVWKGFDRSDYSSYGNGLDIMANGGTIDNPTLSLTDEGVGTMAGTSVATANVTGAASQIWAANPELSYRQVIDILKDTATDLGTPNWNSETGTGLLNMAAAVNLAKATQPETHYAPSSLIPESWSGEGKVTPGERAVSTPFMGKYYDWVPYTIQSGDTLSEIALRTMGNGSATYYNFIAQHNGIANPNQIYTGDTIQIPQEVSAPAPPPSENPGDNNTPTSFTGRIIATIGANVRSGPSTGNSLVGTRNYGDIVTFDQVATGEFISFPSLGTATDKWYKIQGSNEWISAAIVNGSPDNSFNEPPARPGEQQQYIIKSGDTLWGIAQRYLNDGSRWREITKADGSTFTEAEATRLQVGMSVYLPVGYTTGPGTPVEPPPNPEPQPTSWQHPLPGYPVTSEFGERNEPWDADNWHNGIDLGTYGTTPPVKAAKGGTVVIARGGWNDGYGNYIKIDHGNGLETRYAHLSSINVSPGQTVNAGTHIGNVGNTGNSYGNHLHFEIRVNGSAQNPRKYINF
ncbi:MAG: S8 family serine peptidase [Coleofasciculus sp. D1-CHI-01]|uniref:S8 family serine peptidase n=1 Tax=Coleofasciculus sp. D1-CHI-01 TaxID=3068482 RepID=UPI0032FF6164